MTALSDRGISEQALPGSGRMPLLLAALVLGWVAVAYRGTLWSMVGIWERSETFAHGFLVFPIALWLAWRQRGHLAGETLVPSRAAIGALFPIGFLWLLGSLAGANAPAQLAYVALLATCVPALAGWRIAGKLAFPLGFLFFAVPLGEFLIPLLMDWTARFTVLGLRLSGVPVYRDGLDFVIPSGNWSVVEACSGIRYLIASLMAGTLFAYLNFRSPGRRLAFVGVSLVVPVIANWARAYLIVMIGHLSGNRLATGVDHLIYGWLFFGLVVAAIFLVGARWAETGPSPEAPAVPERAAPAAGRPLGWGIAGLVALVASLPALAMSGIGRLERAGPPVLERNLDGFSAGWRPVAADTGWLPAFRDAADAWHQDFERDGQRVSLSIGYYRPSAAGGRPAGFADGLPRRDDGSWRLAATERRRTGLADGPATVNRATLQPRGTNPPAGALVAWQWYWTDGETMADSRWARLRGAWARLRGRGGDGAAIVIHGPAGPAGEAALKAFLQTAEGAINCLLNETRMRP